MGNNIIKTCGTVKVINLRLIYRLNLGGAISALVNKLGELIIIDLIEKLIPKRMIVWQTAKIDKIYLIFCSKSNIYYFLPLAWVKGEEGFQGANKLCRSLCLELLASNLCTADNIGNISVAQTALLHQAPICSGEVCSVCQRGVAKEVRYRRKTLCCNGICGRVIFILNVNANHILGGEGGAVILLAFNHLGIVKSASLGIVLCYKDAVNCLVCVACGSNVIISCIKNVATIAAVCGGIIRGEVLKAYGNIHRFLLTGSKVTGFCKADKNYGRFFYATNIGSLTVNLNYVLTTARTNVFNVYGNIDIATRISGGHCKVGPLEFSIGKTVSEGIDYGILIIILANVFSADKNVLVTGFVVSITNVDSLGIVYVVVISA